MDRLEDIKDRRAKVDKSLEYEKPQGIFLYHPTYNAKGEIVAEFPLEDTAKFFVNAPSDIDYLLAEVARLQSEKEQVRDALSQTTEHPLDWPDGVEESLDALLGIWRS